MEPRHQCNAGQQELVCSGVGIEFHMGGILDFELLKRVGEGGPGSLPQHL